MTIDASDAAGNPLDSARGGPFDLSADGPLNQSSGFDSIGSLTPGDSLGMGATSSAAAGNPATIGNPSLLSSSSAQEVPEPSALPMALVAALGVAITQLARHHCRCQTL